MAPFSFSFHITRYFPFDIPACKVQVTLMLCFSLSSQQDSEMCLFLLTSLLRFSSQKESNHLSCLKSKFLIVSLIK